MPVKALEVAASAVLVGATLAVLVPGQARAGEWTAAAAVSPSVTYTDNVCLSKNNKKSEWIGTLTPSGSIQGKSRRASLNVSGSVNLNSLTNSTLNSKGCNGVFDDRDQYSPKVRASRSASTSTFPSRLPPRGSGKSS